MHTSGRLSNAGAAPWRGAPSVRCSRRSWNRCLGPTLAASAAEAQGAACAQELSAVWAWDALPAGSLPGCCGSGASGAGASLPFEEASGALESSKGRQERRTWGGARAGCRLPCPWCRKRWPCRARGIQDPGLRAERHSPRAFLAALGPASVTRPAASSGMQEPGGCTMQGRLQSWEAGLRRWQARVPTPQQLAGQPWQDRAVHTSQFSYSHASVSVTATGSLLPCSACAACDHASSMHHCAVHARQEPPLDCRLPAEGALPPDAGWVRAHLGGVARQGCLAQHRASHPNRRLGSLTRRTSQPQIPRPWHTLGQ